MDQILDALTRGLAARGSHARLRRRVARRDRQLQSQSPGFLLGLVLPSNHPECTTLWLPVIPMQIGLLLKPGPQEP